MGKRKKIRSGAGDVVTLPGVLHKQIEKSKLAKPKIARRSKKKRGSDDEGDIDQEFLDANLSSKILKAAHHQQEEDGQEDDAEIKMAGRSKKFAKETPKLKSILKKSEHEESMSIDDSLTRDLNPKVTELYKEVGELLSKYRSGKVPKAFKEIPTLVNWEQILDLTKPENWSAAAMFEATRLFASCMSPDMCQRFYNLYLLPRIRDDIEEFKKLNVHLYESLFKAMFKPAAFFKGLLLPWLESGTAILLEAHVFSSVLRKASIPQLHAAAAMLKIAEMDYSGPSALILRTMIEKNFTLPFRALDGLVFHFTRMTSYQGELPLPVLWHQALLSFVQHYKQDMSAEQRAVLLELLKVHSHHQITPEIRHHLQQAESRNVESEANIPEYVRDNDMD